MFARLRITGTYDCRHAYLCKFTGVGSHVQPCIRRDDSQRSQAAIHQGAFVALMRACIIQLKEPPFSLQPCLLTSTLPSFSCNLRVVSLLTFMNVRFRETLNAFSLGNFEWLKYLIVSLESKHSKKLILISWF